MSNIRARQHETSGRVGPSSIWILEETSSCVRGVMPLSPEDCNAPETHRIREFSQVKYQTMRHLIMRRKERLTLNAGTRQRPVAASHSGVPLQELLQHICESVRRRMSDQGVSTMVLLSPDRGQSGWSGARRTVRPALAKDEDQPPSGSSVSEIGLLGRSEFGRPNDDEGCGTAGLELIGLLLWWLSSPKRSDGICWIVCEV
jgi:hypothetical protein